MKKPWKYLIVAGAILLTLFGVAQGARSAWYPSFSPFLGSGDETADSSGSIGTANGILKADGSGNVSAVTVGSGLTFDGTTLATDGSGSGGGLATTSPWTAGQLVQVEDNGTVKSIATSSLGLLTTNVAEGTNQYFTDARARTALSSAYTTGAIPFGNGTNLSIDASNLFWDNTNDRLGIGTTTPQHPLSVIGTIMSLTSSANANIVINNGGTNRLGSMTYQTNGTDRWYTGTPDSDVRGDGTEYFIGTSNSDAKFWMESNGNVGINTSNPQNLLVVGGNQTGNAGLEIVPGSGVVIQSYNRNTSAYASINFDATTIGFRPSGTGGFRIQAGELVPVTTDTVAIGSATLMWSDLFLASGGVLNWNNGDVTLTHSANALDIDGGIVDFGSGPTVNGSGIYYAGGTDVAVADGGTNISSYTTGDTLYASGATTLSKLGIGATGEVLSVVGGVPDWVATSSLNISASAAGDTGYVQFNASDAFEAVAEFFWDNVNKRLGIGTTTPQSALHVADTSTLTATTTTYSTPGSYTYTAPSNVVYYEVHMWGGGGGGGNGGTSGGGGAGSYVKRVYTQATTSVAVNVAQGGQGGTGGTGYAAGGNGTTSGGGGGGSSQAFGFIACGGGGAGGNASPENNGKGFGASLTSGGAGGTGGVSGGGGGGGCATGGSAGSGTTGGAGGTGGSATSGLNGDGALAGNFAGGGGGSSAGASGNGNSGSGFSATGATGSGGASAGTNGSNYDSGGGGQGADVNGGNGGSPGAGAGGARSGTKGNGGDGKVIIIAYTQASPPSIMDLVTNVSASIVRKVEGYVGSVLYTLESLDRYGHFYVGGPAPTVSCTGGSVSGNDRSGIVSMTSGSSCTLTFATPWSSAPICTAAPGANSTYSVSSVSTSSVTFGFGSNQTSFRYICQGNI